MRRRAEASWRVVIKRRTRAGLCTAPSFRHAILQHAAPTSQGHTCPSSTMARARCSGNGRCSGVWARAISRTMCGGSLPLCPACCISPSYSSRLHYLNTTDSHTSNKQAEAEEQQRVLIQRLHPTDKTEDSSNDSSSSSSSTLPPPSPLSTAAAAPTATSTPTAASSPSSTHKRRRADAPGKETEGEDRRRDGSKKKSEQMRRTHIFSTTLIRTHATDGEGGSSSSSSLQGRMKKQHTPGTMTTNGSQPQLEGNRGSTAAASRAAAGTCVFECVKCAIPSFIRSSLFRSAPPPPFFFLVESDGIILISSHR